MPDCAKECTLAMRPERVRNVPKIVRKNVRQMRKTFQTFSIPRRSWIMIECTKAVAVSQRQERRVLDRIPGPVAAPAELLVGPEHAERVADRRGTATRRASTCGDATIHSLSSRPVASAATAKANGTAQPTKPDVEARRVDDHVEVLEQRVQPLAVGARAGDARRERVRGEHHQDAEEEHDRHQRRDDVRLELEVVALQPEHADADVERGGRATRGASRPARPRAR